MDAVALEAVEVGAAMGDQISVNRWGSGDGMVDLVDGSFGGGGFFGSFGAKEIIIPLAAGDLIDNFVVEARVALECGLVFGGERGGKLGGVGVAKVVEFGGGI